MPYTSREYSRYSDSRLNHVACRCVGAFTWLSRDIDTLRNEMMVFEHLYGIG